MRNRLLLTLTTTRGSRQYSLNKLARYFLLVIILVVVAGFLLGNLLLVKTTDELITLESDHRSLANKYEDVLGSREVYKTELDQLSDTLSTVENERGRLQQQFSMLAIRYRDVLGNSEEYKAKLDELADDMEIVETRNQQLQNHSSVVLSERSQWADSLRMLEQKMGLPSSPEMTLERSMELQQIANERLFMLRGIPNGSPLVDKVRLSDRFGMRNHPVTGKRKLHKGLDWSANLGTPVYATADGAVEYSGYHKSSGYGHLLILSHNFGFKTYYGHLQKRAVSSGSVVRKGQLIGYTGNSGISTGPHLHYEVRYLFKPLNPMPFVDWDMSNYEHIFSEVKGVSWESLRELHPLNQLEAPLL